MFFCLGVDESSHLFWVLNLFGVWLLGLVFWGFFCAFYTVSGTEVVSKSVLLFWILQRLANQFLLWSKCTGLRKRQSEMQTLNIYVSPHTLPVNYTEMEVYGHFSCHFPMFLLLYCVNKILGLIHYGSSSNIDGYVVLGRGDNQHAWLLEHMHVLRIWTLSGSFTEV